MKLKRIAFYLYVIFLGMMMLTFAKINNDSIVEKYTYTFQDLVNNKLYIWLIILILFSIVNYFFTKRFVFIKVNEKYYRDYKNTLKPILAEYMIDGKCDIVNLILSCIVDLIERNNLENIDNKKIRLISKEGLTDVETEIINYIFLDETEIEFKELAEMLKNNSKATYNWFSKIKANVILHLYNLGIFNRKRKIIIKCMNLFQKFIYAQILFVLFIFCIGDINQMKDMSILGFIAFLSLLTIISLFVYKNSIEKSINEDLKGIIEVENDEYNKNKLIIKLIFVFIVMIMFCIAVILANNSLLVAVPMLVGILINEFYFEMDKLNVLTEFGKEEYKKIFGLRNYIKDYSIMEKNEVDSVIIWDSYLTYAIAFGLADRVLKKIDKYDLLVNVFVDTLGL